MTTFLIRRPRPELTQWCRDNIGIACEWQVGSHVDEDMEPPVIPSVTIEDDHYAVLFRLAFGREARVI